MNNQTYSVPCIFPVTYRLDSPVEVSVPGSKSITNRALLLATLARGVSVLDGVLFSDDSRSFLKCIQDLGFPAIADEKEKRVTVTGFGGAVPRPQASICVGSAGTAARFLTAYLGVSRGTYRLDASAQMRRRPMDSLLASLQSLGCEITCEERPGHFPFTMKGHGFGSGEISVDIGRSSQFLSALLISACLAEQTVNIHVEGTHGMAYIAMTEAMMNQFGVKTVRSSDRCFTIPGGQHYHAANYEIEPDVSAACYFYAMAPLLNVPVLVRRVHFQSLQGDVAFLKILEKMGCTLEERAEGIAVWPPKEGRYRGVDADMSSCSDQAITLAALAVFAGSPTTIRGIGHIRYQESDRISAIATELQKMGIVCRETEDTLTICPGTPRASLVDTYDDHRMAMGFSLIGLRAPGIVIDNPMCCKKTFETYFDVLREVTDRLR